jgi:1-acyl-sn-glycerol-3-phosphate acyltransferase
LVLTLGGGVGLAAVVPFVHGRTRAVLVRSWVRALIRAAGAQLVVRGPRPFSVDGRGTLVTANHVSWLDIPAMLAVEPLTMVAKTEVRAWPVIGLLAARGGTIFIDRGRLKRLRATVDDMATSLRRGDSVMVFPEGTTWCGRTQGRFRRAPFQAAVDAGARSGPRCCGMRCATARPRRRPRSWATTPCSHRCCGSSPSVGW